MKVFLLLVATALLAAAMAPLAAATGRDVLGFHPKFSPGNFRQCGGRGGSCTGSKNPKCKDARWPSKEGGKCRNGLYCYRVSEYHWGCDVSQPHTQSPSEANKYRQCGGKGGLCTGSKDPKCKDAQWPSDEGGKCYPGLDCYRVSEWHWGCDTHPQGRALKADALQEEFDEADLTAEYI